MMIMESAKVTEGDNVNLSELYVVRIKGVTEMMNRVCEKGYSCGGQLTDANMMLMRSLKGTIRGTGILTARTAAGGDRGVMRVKVNVYSVAHTVSFRMSKIRVRDCMIVRGGGITRPLNFAAPHCNLPTVVAGDAAIACLLDLRRIGDALKIMLSPKAVRCGCMELALIGAGVRSCRRASGACHRRGFTCRIRGLALVRISCVAPP